MYKFWFAVAQKNIKNPFEIISYQYLNKHKCSIGFKY